MTNGEKYKTAQERAAAFEDFCNPEYMTCISCPLEKYNRKSMTECRYAWLELEAEEEKPLPCPCCGADAEIHYEDDIEREGDASVQCKGCFLMTPDYPSDVEAVAAWNSRVAKKCMEGKE